MVKIIFVWLLLPHNILWTYLKSFAKGVNISRNDELALRFAEFFVVLPIFCQYSISLSIDNITIKDIY